MRGGDNKQAQELKTLAAAVHKARADTGQDGYGEDEDEVLLTASDARVKPRAEQLCVAGAEVFSTQEDALCQHG